MESTEFELWHTYEIDGQPDNVRTVITRCVDFTDTGANYVMLCKPHSADDIEIYPVEWDCGSEAMLFPAVDFDDVADRDGNLYPYWINVRECVDVSERYPDEFPPNRI